MKETRATIKDVARLANVSIATVSHVINNTRFVSPEVRARVDKAVRDTRYASNTLARALRSSRTNMIGVIIPDITNPFFAHLIKSLEVALNQNGYSIILCHSRDELEMELTQLETLMSFNVDGVIMAPSSASFDYGALPISKSRPMIYVDRRPMMAEYSGVFCNLRDVLTFATEQLILAGHKSIACLLGPIRFSVTFDRKQGYIDALEKHGIPVRQDLILSGPTTQETGYARMEYLVNFTDATAVLTANGRISLGAMRYVSEHHIKVPERMAIIGLAGYEWYRATTPALTTVLEPLNDMGHAVTNMLLDFIKNPDQPHRQISLDAYMTDRSSY